MAGKSEQVPVKRESSQPRGVLESPLAPLSSLREEIDQLFEELTSDWGLGPFRRRARGLLQRPPAAAMRIPALDLVDKDDEVLIRADLPGMDEKDIEVQLADGALTVSGEKKEEHEEGEKEGRYYLAERRYGAFQRTIPLPEGIDQDKVEASFRKGVLTIHLPKTAEAKQRSKKIEVKAER